MLIFLHKMVIIENEAVLLCVTMLQRARAFSVQLFDIAFAIKEFSLVVHFLNTYLNFLNYFFKYDLKSSSFHVICKKSNNNNNNSNNNTNNNNNNNNNNNWYITILVN